MLIFSGIYALAWVKEGQVINFGHEIKEFGIGRWTLGGKPSNGKLRFERNFLIF